DVKMEEAIKAISTMRGHDLREFMLLAFGGAGPVHASRIARGLGMAGVIVPRYPGVFSAIGLLVSDVTHDYVQSKLAPLAEVAPEDANEMLERLTGQALAELARDGFNRERIRVERALDLRYAGQGYEISVPCPAPRAPAPRRGGAGQPLRPPAPGHVRPHGAGRAGRDRILSRARGRSPAAGRAADRRVGRHHPRRCAAHNAARALRRP